MAPIADALNGYFIFNHLIGTGGIGSPSQLFRITATFFMAYYLFNRKCMAIILALVSYALLLEYTSFVRSGNLSGFIIGLLYSYKILYAVLFFMTLKKVSKYFHTVTILSFFIKGVCIYATVLIGSILVGIDQPTYAAGTFGSKGLYSSGNGLSIFLGVGSLFAFYFYRLSKRFKDLLIWLFILLATLLVGTKASMLFLMINILLLYYYTSTSNKLLSVALVTVILSFYIEEITTLFSIVFDVILLRYEQSESLFSFLASNRDNYIMDALREYNLEGWNVIRVFIGAGVFISFRPYNQTGLIYDTLENDFFDLFFSFGLLGILSYLAFVFSGFILAIKKRDLILFLAWSTIIIYSFIAGHVVFNGMSSIALATVYFFLYHRGKIVNFI